MYNTLLQYSAINRYSIFIFLRNLIFLIDVEVYFLFAFKINGSHIKISISQDFTGMRLRFVNTVTERFDNVAKCRTLKEWLKLLIPEFIDLSYI